MNNSTVRITSFDPQNKSAWFYADFSTAVQLWMVTVMIVIVLCVPLTVIGDLGHLFKGVVGYLGLKLTFGIGISLTFIPAFLVVFVFRLNPMVRGSRRQFRYIYKWL